jgi:glycopeptide antibiotics resistance protein
LTRRSARPPGRRPSRQDMLRLGAAVSIVAALAADLPWGDFQNHTHWGRIGWIPFLGSPVRPFDLAQNLLLFVPLGVFVGLEGGTSGARAGLRVGLITICVSFFGEWSQLYSHLRFPSATDMTCNVIGAVVAAVIAARLTPAGQRGAKAG